MIKKFTSIQGLAVFQSFNWDSEVRDGNGVAIDFKDINVIYGRNYSGKTTLSRIVRAMEVGELSDKYGSPTLCVSLTDGTQVTEASLTGHGKEIRVFNEDFIRENMRFITDPDDSIEPFAILGEDNNKIELEISKLESELGSKELGQETGLYVKRNEAKAAYIKARAEYQTANTGIEKLISDKATDRKIGIKYNTARFGDQNYNALKLKSDIEKILKESYKSLTEIEIGKFERLIAEKTLGSSPLLQLPIIQFGILSAEAETLVTKKISESDKIEELVRDAVLNRWVHEGKILHKGKHFDCALCGNGISNDRWVKLEKHFDEESENLATAIGSLIQKVEAEQSKISSALQIHNSLFYSKFHDRLNLLTGRYKTSLDAYLQSLTKLNEQLNARKSDIFKPQIFQSPNDVSQSLIDTWESYKVIQKESQEYTKLLANEQADARAALRLNEVSTFLITIRYQDLIADIQTKKDALALAEQNGKRISGEISEKEELIVQKKHELNDEEKGAKKVNEYLNGFFGHKYLSLEAREDIATEEKPKQVRFEVIRDSKKAYHLSEGECSLLAFCYFLAKLEDTYTKNSKPIIWIDDPISSLDSNHVFFIYSLINAEIVSAGKFEQLFISTHNLDFLKYLKRLSGKFAGPNGKLQDYPKGYFLVTRRDKVSSINIMPKYLREYVTEFNYLFHQIYKCASIQTIDDSNYTTFYNFGNNARKFFEIYLYYKYPDQGSNEETLKLFFGDEKIPSVLTDRLNNEYSHLSGVFERGATPVEVPEMQTTAQKILERLKQDKDQFDALMKSIGEFAV